MERIKLRGGLIECLGTVCYVALPVCEASLMLLGTSRLAVVIHLSGRGDGFGRPGCGGAAVSEALPDFVWHELSGGGHSPVRGK